MERPYLTGVITKKEPYSGTNLNHPAGYFTIADKRFSLWDDMIYEKLVVGKSYRVEYTERQFGNKTYYNSQHVSLSEKLIDSEKIEFSNEEKEELEEVGVDTSEFHGPKEEILLKEGETVVISGFKYKFESAKLKLVST